MLPLGQILVGDVQRELAKLPDGCVRLVLADPPYNVGKDYGEGQDRWKSPAAYLRWMRRWMRHALRVGNGRLAMYTPKVYLRELWNVLPGHDQLVMGWAPEGAYRKGRMVHNHSSVLVPRPVLGYLRDFHHNVQHRNLGYFCREENTGHPGQSSLQMTELLVEALTKPGDIVLDPFMGCGTTALACTKLGRQWVGIERNPPYAAMAMERVEALLHGRPWAEYTGHKAAGQLDIMDIMEGVNA